MSNVCANCNSHNDEAADVCMVCGTLFEKEKDSMGIPKISLILSDDDAIIEIPEGGMIIGRGSDIAQEVFNHKYVSEYHCKIIVNESGCYVEDIGSEGNGSCNGTYVNSERLPPNTLAKLKNGDSLEIAHLKFNIKIEDIEKEPQLKYIVICEYGKKEHDVKDKSDRISECDCDYCKKYPKVKNHISKVEAEEVRK